MIILILNKINSCIQIFSQRAEGLFKTHTMTHMVSGRRKKIETKSWARPNSKTGTGHHPGPIKNTKRVQGAGLLACRLQHLKSASFHWSICLPLIYFPTSRFKNRNADNRLIGKVFLHGILDCSNRSFLVKYAGPFLSIFQALLLWFFGYFISWQTIQR